MSFVRNSLWPIGATAFLLAGQAMSLDPLAHVSGPAVEGASLSTPLLYVLLAPWTVLSDRLTLLDVEQLWTAGVWMILAWPAWRLSSRKRSEFGWKRETALMTAWLAGVFVFVASVAWWGRPQARLELSDPSAFAFDVHTHTNRSWDANSRFDAEENARWHARAGFHAGFITDHNKIEGALAGRNKLEGPYVERGFVWLVGTELSLHDLHMLSLGCVEGMKGDDYPGRDGIVTAAAAVRRCGGITIGSLPEYRKHYWGKLQDLVDDGLDGFEILNGTPKGLRLTEADRKEVKDLARQNDLLLVAATDNHGWGSVAPGWNIARLPGWEELRSRELERALLSLWKEKRGDSVSVLARRRWERLRGAPGTVADPLFQAVLSSRTASPSVAAALILWVWGLFFLRRFLRLSPRLLAPGIGLLFAALFGSTSTWDFSYDGLCYALDVERGGLSNLFHPNHLLYAPLGRILFDGFYALGAPSRAIPLLQGLNAVAAGTAVGLLCRFLDKGFAYGAALLFGFSFAVWSEAVDPGCYGVAALATVLLLGLMLHRGRFSPLATGLLHGLACLFHQMLFLVAPAFWMLFDSRDRVRYTVGIAAGAGSVYFAIGVLLHGADIQAMVQWFLGPAGPRPDSGIFQGSWWSLALASNAAGAWNGFARALAPGVPGHGLGFLFVLALTLALKSVRNPLRNPEIRALLAWILLMNVFQFFWLPGSERFRILWIPAALALLGILLKDKGRHAALPLALALGGWNAWNVLPRTQASSNPNLMRTLWVEAQVDDRDFFLFGGEGPGSIVNVYPTYFAPTLSARSLRGWFFANPGEGLDPIRAKAEESVRRGGRWWVEAALFDPEFRTSLEGFGRSPGSIADLLDSRKIVSRRVAPDGYTIVELR